MGLLSLVSQQANMNKDQSSYSPPAAPEQWRGVQKGEDGSTERAGDFWHQWMPGRLL